MSFSRFLEDIASYVSELDLKAAQHAEDRIFSGQFKVSEEELDALLEDVTDFARAHGDEPLFEKLSSFGRQDNSFPFHQEFDVAQVKARAIRISRAIETFGRRFLEEERTERIATLSNNAAAIPKAVSIAKEQSNRVFVVHGHDDAVLYRVKETLTVLGLEPIILRDQPNGGQTIIEKFEAYSDVGFAVILMTADDIGGSLKEMEANQSSARARQNVVMELGFFASKLSRGRISVLKSPSVEAPSDIMGVVYTPIDSGEAWRLGLARELSNAGYDIDLNRLK